MIDSQLLKAVVELVQQVGQFQLNRFRILPPGGGDEKQAREFVSDVDLQSEQMLIDGLKKLLPEAGFYGEETGRHGNEHLRWIVDPLDGTTNFLSGLEQFSVSVALEKSGRSELGVVFRPASAECYSALRGQGLQHNGRNCNQVSAILMRQALIGTGFPFRSRDLSGCFFSCAEEVLYTCRGIRRCGSAALDLCYVAGGFLQGFWESDLQPYDVAAALLFMDETGCRVTKHRGDPYSPYRDRILVCGFLNVHSQLLSLVRKHYQMEFEELN